MNCQQHKISFSGALALVALIAVAALVEADQRQLGRLEGDGLGAFGGVSQRLATRFRRQAHPHKLTVGQLAALSQQQQQQAAAEQQTSLEQSLAEADEQTLKRQLPDLIAQAHNDKALERALLRLVISASLRNSNSIREQQQLNNQWQLDNLDNAQNNLAQYNQANSGSVGEFGPIRLGSAGAANGRQLEPSELANLEAQLVASAAELPDFSANGSGSSGGILSSPMDKREYSKPCLFNAISCVRTPFRKLTS